MTTIDDVALAAGVSATTVSHVFSNRRPVAAGTRERVLRAAERLHYQPRAAARDLGAGRSTTIALDIQVAEESLILNPYFGAVMSALASAATTQGFTFMLLPTTEPAIERTLPAVSPSRVVGAIVLEPTAANPWIPRLAEAGVGIVCIGRYTGPSETSWVDNDHRVAIQSAVQHLLGQGYRRLALLTSEERFSYMQDLEDGFEAALRDGDASRKAKGEMVRIPELTEQHGRQVAHTLLGRRWPPDAIIAAIDRVALGVLQAADERQRAVPSELAIVGGGDTVLAESSRPRLTSIRTTPELLAQSAIGLIGQAWADGWPSTPIGVLIPSDLMIRESSVRA